MNADNGFHAFLCTFATMRNNTRTELSRLLQERNEHPERSPQIDHQIEKTFSQTCAILVLDMAGFSRLTIRHGIIHFLSMIHRMGMIALPIITTYGGRVFKQEADNIFALFPNVKAAVAAASDILKCFGAVNQGLPDESDLYAGIGIGYGDLLVIGEDDVYGSEMNLACKLGEDLARRGEILLTEAAHEQIAGEGDWEELELSIAGLELITYKLKLAKPFF